ncbi:hypothetical protein C8R43DRAFT_153197, partial [Mycena crocata]
MQSSASQNRMNRVLTGFNGAADTMDVLAKSLSGPFLGPIASTARSLSIAILTVKKNKDDCVQLLEHTYQLLYAIIFLYTESELGADFPPSTLNNLGKATETLHKIHSFVEAQQDRNIVKWFFQQNEMNALLKACNTGIQEALDSFKVQDVNLLTDITAMQQHAHERHQDVLRMIAELRDDTSSDATSSINQAFFHSQNSSTSISMLPAEPKIFHGRETEIRAILQLFSEQIPKIAILGPGGMGKTSLARAVLHHPDIMARYGQDRFFVPCDAASTQVELASHIGAHLGLEPGKNLSKAVLRHLAGNLDSLLILDNLETVWESTDSRVDVEEFLSLLTDIPYLALIITMRGAERPAKVRWSRPFLEPLKPLSQDAARETFMDITDESHNIADIDKVLLLTENMPLAIDLIAHLVDAEDCSTV